MNPKELKENIDRLKANLPQGIGNKIDRLIGREIGKYLENNPDDEYELASLITPLSTIKSSEILKTEFPPIPWLVSDYLGPGLTFLYGKPKVGKSWLALQLAMSILVGGVMFSKRVEKGKVLFLALEDSKKRLKTRMKAQGWPGEDDVDFILFDKFQSQIGTLNSQGGKRLLANIKAQEYDLVLVDTFSRAIHGNQLKSHEMTQAISPIQQYAMKRNISLVIIDHEPKQGNTLFGSVAKLGIADTFWRLYQKNGVYGTFLSISGRDLKKEYKLELEFDQEHCFWDLKNNVNEIENTKREKELLEALDELGIVQLNEIVERVGQDKANTFRRLQNMANSGQIVRTRKENKVFYELN